MSKDLIDPGDPLATTAELIDNAIEVLDDIRNIPDGEADPEWLDASLEYIKTVLEAVKDRAEETIKTPYERRHKNAIS